MARMGLMALERGAAYLPHGASLAPHPKGLDYNRNVLGLERRAMKIARVLLGAARQHQALRSISVTIATDLTSSHAFLVPMDGLELSTFALRMRCSTN